MDLEYQHINKICLNEHTHEPVSGDELDKAIDKLNRNKSGDGFGITVECIIYGGTKLTELILQTVNASYEHCHVSDILKIGELTPIFKNKGDILNSNKNRGISITPTISKIIETILKFRINPYISDVKNLFERGFTENTVPLISSLLLEEYERENTDLNKPTVFGILDAKSAFDVICHSYLIRKLYHMGISKQAILMTDNLYKNDVSKINWKRQSSEPFPINQSDRQ
jgi:hypothetical protein